MISRTQGRLTHPLRYDAASDRYVEVYLGGGLRRYRRRSSRATIRRRRSSTPRAGPRSRPPTSTSSSRGSTGTTTCPTAPTCATRPPRWRCRRASARRSAPACSTISRHATRSSSSGRIPGPTARGSCTRCRRRVERGVPIVTFNPMRERGWSSFVNPQRAGPDADQIRRPRSRPVPSGRAPAATSPRCWASCKMLLRCERRRRRRRRPRARPWPSSPSTRTGFDAFEAKLRETSWDEIEREFGPAAAPTSKRPPRSMSRPKRVIGVYGMGLTQHVHGVDNIADAGQPAADARRISAGPAPASARCAATPTSRASARSASPRSPSWCRSTSWRSSSASSRRARTGMTTVEVCEAIIDGEVRAFIGLGGNFVRAIPEQRAMEASVGRIAADRSRSPPSSTAAICSTGEPPICCPASAAARMTSRPAARRS